MLVAVLLSALVPQAEEPLVAYAARHYPAPGSTGAPTTGVYIVGWDGRNRVTVAKTQGAAKDVWWSGRNRIVWSCGRSDGGVDVWTSPWPEVSPTLAASERAAGSSHLVQGVPLLQLPDASWATVTPSGEWTACAGPLDPYAAEPAVTSKDGRASFTLLEGESVSFTVSGADGRVHNDPGEGRYVAHRYDRGRDVLWIQTAANRAQGASRNWLYTVDWATGALVARLKDYGLADHWPGRAEAAFCPAPALVAYGSKKKVLVSPLYTGNLRRVQFAKAVGGWVHVTGVAVRPQ